VAGDVSFGGPQTRPEATCGARHRTASAAAVNVKELSPKSFAFYAGDIRVEGPHPFCSSGGNLVNGRTRTAMYTDSIEQLRGTAGARQVRVRAETALAAFTTPSSGGWIMIGKYPS
jgi:hypothetical protein